MKRHRFLLFFLLIYSLLFVHKAFAQAELGDLRVDQLSEAQVRNLMQRAESIGYDDAQLEQMARAQGMSATEVEKLKKRVADIRKQDSQRSGDSKQPTNQSRQHRNNTAEIIQTQEIHSIIRD